MIIKSVITLLVFLGCVGMSYAQQLTQKANFGGTARTGAVAFSIGAKGYVATGQTATAYTKDVWEYDPATDAWSQKADFAGPERAYAVGMAIGNKGYVGTGYNANGQLADFWEYTPTTNTWTQKADFGGGVRCQAVGWSINGKGYIGTGSSFGDPRTISGGGELVDGVITVDGIVRHVFNNDFWEFNPSLNSWTQKANVPDRQRYGAVGFSIGSKGYIGSGDPGGSPLDDFNEYDPTTDQWVNKTTLLKFYGAGFSIGTKGYVVGGKEDSPQDTWALFEYDSSTETFTQVYNDPSDPGPDVQTPRSYPVAFAIGNKGYIGLGDYTANGFSIGTRLTDFWELSTTAVLPVTLRYFNGRMTDVGALMEWQTATETNSAYFSIERSRDLTGFEAIANVPSQALQGNSARRLTYAFTDTQHLPGVNYYRLTQVDQNGTRTTSRPIALSKENQPPVLYPNPVGTLGEATLEPALAYRSYEVVDMQGRVVQQAAISGTLSRLSVGTLPAGVYLLRVQTEGGSQQVFRLLR